MKKLLIAFAFFAAGCGATDDSDSAGAKVQVAFNNLSGVTSALNLRNMLAVGTPSTPEVFAMKLVVMYLVPDVDPDTQNNIGTAARIWQNPVCDDDLTFCGIGEGAGEYRVTDYFDFALPTEEVNANLVSQGRTVAEGTYKYLRVDFMGYNNGVTDSDTPNFKFGPNASTTHEIRPNWGNGYTVALAEPIEIVAGETVDVTIEYDYADSYYADASNDTGNPPEGGVIDNWSCVGSGNPATGPCLYFSGFAPSAKKAD